MADRTILKSPANRDRMRGLVAERLPPIGFSRFLLTEHEPQIALGALTRLRGLGVVGQLAATVGGAMLLRLRFPIAPIVVVVVVTAVSNAAAVLMMRHRRPSRWLVHGLLLLDVGSLTALLYYTGGATNPFSMLYLVHVAMAVTVLGSAWTWVVVAMAAAGYGALFVWNVPLTGVADIPPLTLAVGHWLALALVAVSIAVFIGRVEHSLRDREHEVVEMRERMTKNELLATLTTLAAGAAHELNTPLGTIAVVAKELEVSSGPAHDAESIREDARLIRREVDRCREIINRLRLDIGEDVAERQTIAGTLMVKDLRKDLREAENARLRVLIGSGGGTGGAPGRGVGQALLVLLRNAVDASPPRGGGGVSGP